MKKCAFLVIGGGIIGLSVARALKKRQPRSKIVLIEKEKDCTSHASGRNSGVLHAGFYYSSDSLKARFTQQGNRLWTEYCHRKKCRIHPCGKLVVAKDESESASLDELLRRGEANGVPLEMLTEEAALKLEPRVRTCQRALFSPTTSSIDPVEVTQSVKQDAIDEGIDIQMYNAYLGHRGDRVRITDGEVEAGFVINSAGLYADKIAMDYGFSKDFRILPFKGLYLYSDEAPYAVKTNIYPVPNLKNPFLGVHFTVLVDGRLKIGPTAIPAFWREAYEGWSRFKLIECLEILWREAGLFMCSNFDFKKLAFDEIRKSSRSKLVSLAQEMMNGIHPDQYQKWGRPGIRAQLVSLKSKQLVMDFVLEGDAKSLHILNAVSPGFTCALPFAEYVTDRILAAP